MEHQNGVLLGEPEIPDPPFDSWNDKKLATYITVLEYLIAAHQATCRETNSLGRRLVAALNERGRRMTYLRSL
jgi:hypothetical protein